MSHLDRVCTNLFCLVQTSVVYHLMSLTVCILAFTAYLMKALRTADVWIRYLDWGLATPLLLIDLACESRLAATPRAVRTAV